VRASLPLLSFSLALLAACGGGSPNRGREVEIGNPYETVNWQKVSHYRADFHLHTLQSDGCHLPDEVVRSFHDAGFSVLAITDHDSARPNLCRPRSESTAQAIDAGAFADQPTPYPDPPPPNLAPRTTWPWPAFGAPSPGELGMVGIEGAELTCGYHLTSLFNDYGERPCGDARNDGRLREVAQRGGLAVLNHPDRIKEPLEWFVDLFREHPAESLVGTEIAGDDPRLVVPLWDQLLGELMPSRPIWGFGTSDTHILTRARFGFTVLLLDELTSDNAKAAMRSGRFYSVVGPKILNLSKTRGDTHDGASAYEGTYPTLRSIVVDRNAGRIAIDASGYDEIVWVSKPASTTPVTQANGAASWPAGQIVQRGPVFDFSRSDPTLPYVRAEIIRNTDAGPVRLFTNPFGLKSRR